MKIVIAPDKFRGSLSAFKAAEAIMEGVKSVLPDADVVVCPMADGGEGTLDIIAGKTGADIVEASVHGPLPGSEVEARWAAIPPRLPDGVGGESLIREFSSVEGIAVIEMAQASGLLLIPENLRDPMKTTTLGTGDLIAKALDAGFRQFVVGLGGSGTNDAGMGVAARLGYRFLDAEGGELFPCGASLEKVAEIDCSSVDPRLKDSRILVATDVDNPLVGESGAARVYGPQKGATPDKVETLEKGLLNLGRLLNKLSGRDVINLPGAGAAGGLGAGMVALCGAGIEMGAKLVASMIGLKAEIEDADMVLTGEGAFDVQSGRGKVPFGVAAIASECGVPVIVVTGKVRDDEPEKPAEDFGVYCVAPGPLSEEEAVAGAGGIVREGTARLMKIIKVCSGIDFTEPRGNKPGIK